MITSMTRGPLESQDSHRRTDWIQEQRGPRRLSQKERYKVRLMRRKETLFWFDRFSIFRPKQLTWCFYPRLMLRPAKLCSFANCIFVLHQFIFTFNLIHQAEYISIPLMVALGTVTLVCIIAIFVKMNRNVNSSRQIYWLHHPN